MNKRTEEAFGKKIYLLGKNKYDENVWLEAPSWDCNHYWGFGYLETYTNNNNPQNARDITSHTHYNTTITITVNKEYKHHINENPNFKETTLTNKEAWKLSELMKTFYILKETSELFETGSAHIATNPCNKLLKNKKLYNLINKKLLPAIFEEIDKLLSP